jgi:hypothetical protein
MAKRKFSEEQKVKSWKALAKSKKVNPGLKKWAKLQLKNYNSKKKGK